MFGKLKEKLVEKAFGFAFVRYDKDNTGMLDKDEITSLINDVFQLIRIPRQVSWMETMLIMKMFDSDGAQGISKDEAYEACKNALAKFGGIQGIAKFAGFGKTSSGLPQEGDDQYSHIPKQEVDQQEYTEGKTSGKLDFNPPEDIDISMLDKLPPPGQNLKPDDLKTHKQIEPQPKVEELKPQQPKQTATKEKSAQKKQAGKKKQQKPKPQGHGEGQGHGHGHGKEKKEEEGGFLL